jgi:hypothetical protein
MAQVPPSRQNATKESRKVVRGRRDLPFEREGCEAVRVSTFMWSSDRGIGRHPEGVNCTGGPDDDIDGGRYLDLADRRLTP